MTLMNAELLGLPRGRALTRADLDAMPDDGYRYELIDGTLIVSPAPRPLHQRVVAHLYRALFQAAPANLDVLFAPLDVALTDDTIIQPDLIVAPREAFTERDLPGAPLLAVEVISSSTRGIDMLLKKDRLRRAACPHYWVVEPDVPSIIAWDLQGGSYHESAHATGTQPFETTAPFPVAFTPVDLRL